MEDPVEVEDEEGNPYFLVPENIQPVMAMHSIEVVIEFEALRIILPFGQILF